jgi:hypothetical protein
MCVRLHVEAHGHDIAGRRVAQGWDTAEDNSLVGFVHT